MEATVKYPTFQLDNRVFEHMGDLEWHDGTLLGLVREQKSKNLFIIRWVDVTESAHRWLFFPVSPRTLNLYLDGSLTDEDLMLLNSPNFVQLVDLNGDYQIQNVQKINVDDLPKDYRPSQKAHFNAPSCPDIEEIRNVLKSYPTQTAEIPINPKASREWISRLLEKNKVKKGDNIQIFTQEQISGIYLLAFLLLLASVFLYFFNQQKQAEESGEKMTDHPPPPDMAGGGDFSNCETPDEAEAAIEKTFGITLEIRTAA